jgi:hypothetical protein
MGWGSAGLALRWAGHGLVCAEHGLGIYGAGDGQGCVWHGLG